MGRRDHCAILNQHGVRAKHRCHHAGIAACVTWLCAVSGATPLLAQAGPPPWNRKVEAVAVTPTAGAPGMYGVHIAWTVEVSPTPKSKGARSWFWSIPTS